MNQILVHTNELESAKRQQINGTLEALTWIGCRFTISVLQVVRTAQSEAVLLGVLESEHLYFLYFFQDEILY